ncbi:DnaJ domain-containing protein [Formicincola oecophyllae]|uniref:DnaJ domain-containing protein n=1 Tax=Formicincola oecophyllae TaxID=2558361 RepID=A0A4Y6UC56_9PROT|nr:TerB family tellurite resistance protein [Formicincola oecophyllae]QDH14037.1 DnaJ domain-containing protein [Formicincola oecophyllae]
MAIWGKMFGGVAGFAMGGPLGAALGLVLGDMTDRKTILKPINGTWADNFPTRGTPDPTGAAFFGAAKMAALLGRREQLYAIGLIMLCAKLARIDGPVKQVEIDAFKGCFQFPPESQREVGLMFDNARNRTDDYMRYATELGAAYRDDPEPLETLLAVMFRIARVDLPPNAPLHPAEESFLRYCQQAFHLNEAAWRRCAQGQPRAQATGSAAECYEILGVARSASTEDIRLRWRALVRQHHPDVLARQNLTPAQAEAARLRIARINAAWDRIKRDRSL